jgi:hypothetical protein
MIPLTRAADALRARKASWKNNMFLVLEVFVSRLLTIAC